MNVNRSNTITLSISRAELIQALRLSNPDEFLLQQLPVNGARVTMTVAGDSVLLSHTACTNDDDLRLRRAASATPQDPCGDGSFRGPDGA